MACAKPAEAGPSQVSPEDSSHRDWRPTSEYMDWGPITKYQDKISRFAFWESCSTVKEWFWSRDPFAFRAPKWECSHAAFRAVRNFIGRGCRSRGCRQHLRRKPISTSSGRLSTGRRHPRPETVQPLAPTVPQLTPVRAHPAKVSEFSQRTCMFAVMQELLQLL